MALITTVTAALTGLGGLIGGFATSFFNLGKDLIKFALDYISKHGLAVLFFFIFGAFALNLMGSLLAFLLYHISSAITLSVSPFVTPFTAGLLVNFTLGIFFLFIGHFIYKFFK